MSDDEPLHQPHDKLFKAGFGNPVHAAAFLRGQLPAEVASLIDWDRLRLEPGNFVDSHYRRSESDLLFSAPLRRAAEDAAAGTAADGSSPREDADGGPECLMMLRYILGADVEREAFERRVEAISDPQTRASAMTLAQQYRQEGRQEGLREGIERGRREGVLASLHAAVLEALEVRFGPVAAGVREAVVAIDDNERLRRLLRAAIEAESPAEFLLLLEPRS